MSAATMMDEEYPRETTALREALVEQRKYTLALYADLPTSWWEPARFPRLPIVNPALWELAHIAWFAEFFCLRWRADDVEGTGRLSRLAGADALFDSKRVPHAARWINAYPSRQTCFEYMRASLADVLDALAASAPGERESFQLALAHEEMHGEALVMTLATLGLPLPACVPARRPLAGRLEDVVFAGGAIVLGDSGRGFVFDNEQPPHAVAVEPFAIAAEPVSAEAFEAFVQAGAYDDERFWSPAGVAWRGRRPSGARRAQRPGHAVMHVSWHEAEAWCRWAGRRLPTEAEWEFAAARSAAFRASCGHVWEWTASPFAPFPGFAAGRYGEYSAPWFHDHQVLKGASFATGARLRYPQYRNFYRPERDDMFCGFRTCALAS